jgi:hypothetical protein
MKRISLSVPQFMFVVTTRAALAAGVALLFSPRLSKVQRRAAGASLVGLGGAWCGYDTAGGQNDEAQASAAG